MIFINFDFLKNLRKHDFIKFKVIQGNFVTSIDVSIIQPIQIPENPNPSANLNPFSHLLQQLYQSS